ncbi:MAG: hypothetical protein GXX95_01060 [Methanomassiliicoccus sp.]|nr:hypothetical protein [Methanomassiliicoccus sp.]
MGRHKVNLMKGIVAFDSVYGNTLKVAEAIAEELRAEGQEIEVMDLGKRIPWGAEADFAFIGSPTRMAKMTGRTRRFLKRLKKEHWSAHTIVAFDTVLKLPEDPEKRSKSAKWTEDGAGPKIKAFAEEMGMKVHPEVLRAEVVGLKGPLAPDALDKSREFARRVIKDLL